MHVQSREYMYDFGVKVKAEESNSKQLYFLFILHASSSHGVALGLFASAFPLGQV